MRVFEVSERSIFCSHSCEICQRKIRAGQWVLHAEQRDTFVRKVISHVACVRSLIADVPDEDGDAFEDLRQRIIATGQAFPS